MHFELAQQGQAARRAWTERILVAVAATILSVYVAFGYLVAINTHNGLDPARSPVFYDFSAFYQAGALADSGHAAAAYDDAVMIKAEQAAFPGNARRLPWNYPPTFQLLLTPLAALPYIVAGIAWCAGLYALYALMGRWLVSADRLWIVLLAPGAAVNILVGQNGLLSTALIGGGVLLVRSRPLLGGALLGLMAYKPHFAVLIPVVLIAGREWRALGAAAVSGVGFALLAAVVLGIDPWIAFLHKAIEPSSIFGSSSSSWRNIPSVMIMARTFGVDARLASILHWSVAALAGLGAAWAWRRTADPRLRAGALAVATLIVTPYLRFYDLALLILPIAALLPDVAARRGLGQGAVLLAAWALPAAVLFAPMPVQLGPVVVIAIMGMILWRVAREGNPASAALTLNRP